MTSDRLKVVFIEGSGRSGSTLLDALLGQLPGFFSTGELWFLWDRLSRGDKCGCGALVPDCQVWRHVLREVLDEATGVTPESITRWRDGVLRRSEVPLALTPLLRRRIRARHVFHLRLLLKMYRTISDVTGARVIVDSSKSPVYRYLLGCVDGLDVRYVHLVRDPRAVAFSWTRNRRDDWLAMRPITRSVRDWIRWEMLASLLSSQNQHRQLTVRYEDLVAHARFEIERITEHLLLPPQDLTFIDAERATLQPNHTVGGNPSRFRTGSVRLVADREWERRMPTRYVAAATLACWPWLFRYGYPLRAPTHGGGERAAAGCDHGVLGTTSVSPTIGDVLPGGAAQRIPDPMSETGAGP